MCLILIFNWQEKVVDLLEYKPVETESKKKHNKLTFRISNARKYRDTSVGRK